MAGIDYILHDLMMKEASELTPGKSYNITIDNVTYNNLLFSRRDIKGNLRFYLEDGEVFNIHEDKIKGVKELNENI